MKSIAFQRQLEDNAETNYATTELTWERMTEILTIFSK
jgi:hypothetical protein